MTIDFASLLGRQTVADIRTAFTAACNAVAFKIETLPPLSRLRKIGLDALPVIVEAATRVNAEAIRGGLLDFASGQWVDLLAVNLFGIVGGRILQTFATTPITFTNAGANEYHLAAGEARVSNGVATYRTTGSVDLAPAGNPGASTTVDVVAVVAGSAGNANAGTITTMVTHFDGVTCTNAGDARGSDRETDEQLKTRCRLSRSALSNAGHVDALRFVALSALRTDGTAIGVTRIQVLDDDPSMGDVTTYLADADGPPATDDVTRIDLLLRTLVVPTGVNYLGTFGATEVTVNVVATAYARSDDGFEDSELISAAQAAVDDLMDMYRVGGEVVGGNGLLFKDDIRNAISDARPPSDTEDDPELAALLRSVAVTTPAADVALDPGEIPSRGTFALTITRY